VPWGKVDLFPELFGVNLLVDFVLDLIRSFAEFPNGFADRFAHFGEFFRPKNEQGDGHDHEKLGQADISEHGVLDLSKRQFKYSLYPGISQDRLATHRLSVSVTSSHISRASPG
jgi:hypothetical protein